MAESENYSKSQADITDKTVESAVNKDTDETAESTKESYEFFWRSDSPFSQWHISKFNVNGTTFNSAEQYMMYEKAVLFGDQGTAREIMNTTSPRKQKSLGRKVRNFDETLWEKNCFDIVKRGNEGKFSQNEDLKKILMETHPKTLVEASPVDRIWGIGLAVDNPLAWKKETWEGKNLLGYALTEVRDELMRKDKENSV